MGLFKIRAKWVATATEDELKIENFDSLYTE